MSKNQIYLIVGGGCFLALCAVTALLVGTLYIVPRFASQLNPVEEITNTAPDDLHPNVDRNSMGDPNAPIQIVEFGDFQCPFCKRFHTQTEPPLISDYIKTGKVHFTYRSAGNWVSQAIGDGNTESQDAALAAYCAADQNKFWDMHDALFDNNKDVENQGSFSDQRLSAIAENVGLDTTKFQDCYDNSKYADQVQLDYNEAVSSGVQGTPSFVVTYSVNGQTKTLLIEGAQPFTAFQQTLDAILQSIDQQINQSREQRFQF